MERLAAIFRLDHSPDAASVHTEGQTRALQPLKARERAGEIVTALSFLAAVAALLVTTEPSLRVGAPTAVVLILSFALISRVEFAVGTGYTAPAQLVFVPMLSLLPPALVPPAVALGFVLAKLP